MIRFPLECCLGWPVILPLTDGREERGLLLSVDGLGVCLEQDGEKQLYLWEMIESSEEADGREEALTAGERNR
jgi:hypothetical protein